MGIRAVAALIAVGMPVAFGTVVASAAPAQPTRNVIQVPASGGVTPRVIGGTNANPVAWPYITTVLNPEGLCSGELIGARWVLTARHCVTSESTGAVFAAGAMRVAVGVGNLSARHDWLTPVRIVPFPGFRPSVLVGDLALIELRTPNTRQTVELAASSPDPTLPVVARIAGWGLTSDGAQTPPNLPQQADTMIWPQSYCATVYPPDPAAGYYYDATTELCAGGPADGGSPVYPSVCNGDSGGPLTLPGRSGAWTDRLVGITDYGVRGGCASAPNVFQSIPDHLGWLVGTTGLGAVGILHAHQTTGGHVNAVITVRLRAAQARTTIVVLNPAGQTVTVRRAQAWHPQPVQINVTGLVPGTTVRGYRIVTTNAYGTSGAIGVVLHTTPVACVLRANGACPARNLSGRNLSRRDLSRIDLRDSNLSRASLTGAVLIGARLGGANLTAANLTEADLNGADLTGATWSGTTCPDGSNSSTNGTTPATCIGH